MNATKKYSLFRFLSIIAVMLLAITAAGPVAAQSDAPAQCVAGDFAYSTQTGMLNFVGSKPGMAIQSGAKSATASPEAAARSYLARCGSLFGLSDQAAELAVLNQSMTADGRSVIRFQQVYQGVPVYAGVLLVQVDKSRNVILANGDVTLGLDLEVQPTFDSAAAQQKAIELVAQKHNVAASALKAGTPVLYVYNPALLSNAGDPSLVWGLEVTPVEVAPIRELVLVDATSGVIALNFNKVNDSLQRYTYNLYNSTSYPGTLICSDPTTCSPLVDSDVYYAHYYSGATYNFYSSTFGRDSLDNAGMSLYSYTHYSSGYCNAFWDGAEMTYGDGCDLVVDDVVGHEMTHGVTEHTSNLIYSYESGAINESMSDIFGKGVAFYLGNDTGTDKWLLGEDSSVGAFRDMANPPAYGDPDRMGSPLYYHGSGDNGGVHYNSGVGNKAAFLITDGQFFNGINVTGIGWAKTMQIYYETNAYILVPSSNYSALGHALVQACNYLTGSYGITAADCTQVSNAAYATEMLSDIPTPIAPTGSIIATSPTYKWSALPGVTQYRYQVKKGTSTIFTKTVSSGACSSTTCSNKPALTLSTGNYSWRVQANKGGTWYAYSAWLPFKVIKYTFNDDFGGNSGWTPVNGKWSIASSAYQSTGVNNAFASTKHKSIYTEYTFEAKFKRTGCTGCANFIYFNGNPALANTSGDWTSGYYFAVANNGYFSLWRVDPGGVWTSYDSWAPGPVTASWNTLRVSYNQTTHYTGLFINNIQVDAWYMNMYTSGQVGAGFYKSTGTDKFSLHKASLYKAALDGSTFSAELPSASDFPVKYESDVMTGSGSGSPFMAP